MPIESGKKNSETESFSGVAQEHWLALDTRRKPRRNTTFLRKKGWSGFPLFDKKCTMAFNRTLLLTLIEVMEVEEENGAS